MRVLRWVLTDCDVIPPRLENIENIENINPFDISVLLRSFIQELNIMALETVPKDLRHLRACLLCSLVKVNREPLSSSSANM